MNQTTFTYLQCLYELFSEERNAVIAEQQEQYMKHNFSFFGIKTPRRRELQSPFLIKNELPPKAELFDAVQQLWQWNEREMQMFGQELVAKYVKHFEPNDIVLLEYMITNKSWWDSVDFIAANLVGPYFIEYPDAKALNIERWLESGNIWLQRTCLLYQLKYGKETDLLMLINVIDRLNGSGEFFINKAIGWALRQYGKVDPHWVEDFVNNSELSALCHREALKLIAKV